ncbi:hypothetical protein SAMN05443144_12441 [Fodinibius roseus]|uniref:Protein TonB, links inner and outer membranes n=1 Tax=Fodinibius roseus TaxID=1194090 RepID=A0A1M5IRS0_9BACT|nr:energy transducer TonB [Fodinibius roseus]SHG31032.1 hypothetical protein SAMN05443144_12441 [Fodinibius roseus]
MADSSKYNLREDSQYRIRMLSAIIVAQLIILAFVKFWPAEATRNQSLSERDFSENVVMLEDAVMTRQVSGPPPPPRPTAPIPEPTDEIIEEEITELDDIQFSENADPLSESTIGDQGRDEGPVAGSPDQPPRIIRIVEPPTPEAAQRANIKAEITVNFLVGTDGRVEEATIEQIRLYEGPDSRDFTIVDTINYGLTEVTLDAALQWKFQPARNNGQPVRTYSKQIFTFGF